MKKEEIEIGKFGGAFFDSKVIHNFSFFKNKGKKLYVVSAVKGMTRLLQLIFDFKIQKDLSCRLEKKVTDDYLDEFKLIHTELIGSLFKRNKHKALNQFDLLFCELQETVNKIKSKDNDEHYASTLQYGELASSQILSNYLTSIGIKNILFDARNYVLTSSDYRSAKIISVEPSFEENFSDSKILITQGFIGRSILKKNTVLYLDGSDESAAKFTIALSEKYKVKSTFFKDVPGVFRGNPKDDPTLEMFDMMTPLEYSLLVEETKSYVVKPDAILDLSKAGISVRVRSYIDLKNKGTLIK